MAKGSNNLRSKKSHASKPYDVSNSFVKKVSSLLPQSSWLSRWLTPPVQTLPESDAESESEAEEENGAQPPPSKRAKIPLNRPFPTNSFRVASPSGSQGLPEQLPENATSTPIRSAFEDAVAGPSGLGRSRLHAAPAFQPSPSVAHSENLEGKLNGDGCSDSSESTSGCSSLVPQASRQIQSDSLAARRRSIDENLSLTNHLQSPRSLFPNRVRSPRFTPSMSRRRPSFNVSAYGSPLLESEKSMSKDKDSSMISPFYSGQTMYGGASAYRRPRDGMLLSEMSMSKHAVQVRPVTPAKDSAEMGMSHTARRILEALEQFSTPVSNAKRMPLVESAYVPPLGSKRKRPLFESTTIHHQSPGPATRQLTIPTVPDILKMRRREQLQDSMEKARLMAANEPYRLRTEHDNATEGKRSGKVTKSNPLDEERLPDGVNLPNIVLPITSLPKFDFMVPPAQTFASRHTSVPPKTSSHTLAPLKTSSHTLAPPKTSSHTLAPPKTSSHTLTPPQTSSHTSTLPKTTSHTLSSHNTISHTSAPKASSHVLVSPKPSSHTLVSPKTSSHSLVSPKTSSHILTTPKASDFSLVPPIVSDFTFAPPIKVVGNFQALKPTTDNFTFSKPLSAKRTENCVKNFIPSQSVEAERKSTPVCDVNSNRVVVPKNNGQNSDVATELKTSSVMDVVDKKEVEMGKGDSRKEKLGSGGFGTMFKPPANSWECSMCMIRNNSDSSKCAACMAPRPQTKKAATLSGTGTTTTTSSLPAFGSQFKLQTGMWECPSCMVRNKDSDAKCKACTGAKPGAKAVCPVCLGKNVAGSQCQACQANKPASISTVISTGGFGDKFRKPEGSWSCAVCMLINKKEDANCSACQEVKPGPVKPVTSSPGLKKLAQPLPATEKPVQPSPASQPASSLKFNFPIPPEANTFKFGIDKAGEKATKPVTSDSCKGFVFGASAPTPPVNFKFGVSAPVSDPVVSKPQVSAPVPTLPIATTAAAPTTSGTLSSVGTVSSTSPTASPTVVFAKPAVPSKKVLTSFGNTQPQSRDSTTKSTTSEDTNKGLTSDVADSSSDSKGFKFGGSIGGPAVSTSEIKRPEKRPLNNEQTKKDEPPAKKDESTKKESSDSGKSIPSVEAKPTFAFTAPSSTPAALTPATPTVSNPVKSVKTASVAPTFNFTVNPSSAAGALSTTITTSTTATTSTPSLFTFGKTATTLPSFGASLKSSVPAFTFGSNNSPTGSFKSQDVSATKKKAVSFGGNATSATSFGVPTNISKTIAPVSTNFGSPLPTVAGSTFGTNTAPSFGAATTPTTAPLTFGTSASKPSFATPSSSTPSFSIPTTKVPDFAMPTTAPTFGTAATPAFGSGFSSSAVLKQPSAPSSTTHPFIFGSTSSSGTPSAAFSFSGAQNGSSAPTATAPKVPTFNFGASSNTANLAPASVSTPGFGGFNFSGSSGAAPAAPSVFGGTTSTSTSFGPSNTSASFNAPTFNFGAGSQPFGFSANPSSGIQSAQTVTPVAPTFSFGGQAQPQPAALPTFNPNARPTFNFTGGETPQFTAAASTSATTPTVRRIKKAVRRNVR